MKKVGQKLVTKIISIVVIVIAIWFGWTQLSAWANKTFNWSLPELSFGPLQADPVMGYNTSEIKNIIAGQSREKAELIVYEQDLEVESEVSNTLLNISWFQKTQTIHTFGTGIYVVDLSNLTADDITVDEKTNTITVRVPHVYLKLVNIDITKTTFDDIDRNIFGWGDIKLTPEQTQVLQADVQNVMEEECKKAEYITLAEESGSEQIRNIYLAALSQLNADTTINIVFH